MGSVSNPARRPWTVRHCGLAVGVRLLVCVASPGWERDGWPRPTTQRPLAEAWAALGDLLIQEGKDPLLFPNALATMWCYITEDSAEAARILEERVAPAVHRPMDLLRDRLAVGPAERFAEQLNAFAAAGVQRVFIWPVADETYQLERFVAEVLPVIDG